MDPVHVHRPRNVGWGRAAALLYGDWGTSKAYVIGLAFLAMGYASLPVILAVCALTGLVGYNYAIVCSHFPEGGGVYSSARLQSRLLAVVGALLLVADLAVTASTSGWAAMAYFQVPPELLAHTTIGMILVVGLFNIYGPRHSGGIAVLLAVPMVAVVVVIILLALPHLTTRYLQPAHPHFSENWVSFVNVILALSGVEAIANLTGVMPLDPGSTRERPKVSRTSGKAIFLVALEVVGGTALLGWAMLSLPPEFQEEMRRHYDNMLTVLAVHYGEMNFGVHFANIFGFITALIVGFLLLSAVNTAIVALIGLLYLLAQDGEMPGGFTRLNRHGVPWLPMAIATVLPIGIVLFASDLRTLAGLYAIGVVGAIAVNLGSCVLNRNIPMSWFNRGLMAVTTLILLAVEFTLAKTKPNALFFIVCILIGGLTLRAIGQRKRLAPPLAPGSLPLAATPPSRTRKPFPTSASTVKSIMVAARGLTPVVRFALDEAAIRGATLYILYVRQVAVTLPVGGTGPEEMRWTDDAQAAHIISGAQNLGRDANVRVEPLYVVSNDVGETIVDLAEELHIDLVILGVSQRRSLLHLLSGNTVQEVCEHLPSRVQLIIHG